MPHDRDDLFEIVWCGSQVTIWGKGSLLLEYHPSSADVTWQCVYAARSGVGLGTLRRDLIKRGFRRPQRAMTVVPQRRG